MNSMQLKDKLRNISKEKNVDFNYLDFICMIDLLKDYQKANIEKTLS